jgi:predicted patatin/cPLA2 family phospholipase
MMRKIGYKTFDGFIDEGYDSLPTHERMEYLIESIRKVDNIKNKIEWFKSMEDILEHNYNTLISKLFSPPEAYNELKNYCIKTTKKLL